MACCGGKPCGPSGVDADKKSVEESVQEYYGKIVKTKDDLKTGTCMVPAKMSQRIKKTMGLIHDEVIIRNYGCGLPFPEAVDGCNVLDLGSGTGRDAFVLSKLVGPSGKVVGVDMTQEQLDVANEYVGYHMEKFGYETPNVEFKKGFLEDLREAGVPDDFFDSVVSNCVINLCKNKKAALAEAFRVMKVGGEIYFSDIYSDKDIPEEAQKDKEAWGECLSGALCWTDLHDICAELGFTTPALVTSKTFPLMDERIAKMLDGVKFVSATYRIFKPDPEAERVGASVTYRGTIEDHEESFPFAKGVEFPKGKAVAVGAEIAGILRSSRYGKHFDVASGSACCAKKIGKIDPFCGAEVSEGGCC